MVRFTVITFLAACAAGLVAAEDVLTEMYLVGFSSQAFVASVIKSDATATTFSVTCADTASCALPTDFKFTQGPSTLHYDYTHKPTASDDPSGSIELGCAITSSISGECSKTVSAQLGTITSTAVSASTTFTNAASDLAGHIVTVTAGKLVVPTTASSTTSSSSSRASSKTSSEAKSSTHSTSSLSSSRSSSSSSASGSDSSSTVIVSTATVEPQPATTAAPRTTSTSADDSFFQASATVAISTSTSAGAMPMITAPAQWLMGGAAAALALAAL